MMRHFRSDMNFLAKYHERFGLGLLSANAALVSLDAPELSATLWFLPSFWMLSSPRVTIVLTGLVYSAFAAFVSTDVSPIQLLGIPLAILATFPITALLHCASHDSLRPRWLNRPVGELMGLIQLYGFPDWKVLHVIHHSHSDDLEHDPHAPGDKSYWNFTTGMRTTAMNAFLKYYFKQFGKSPETAAAIARFSRASKFDTVMKLAFWFLLLGPQTFAFFYTVSIGFKMLHYAWLNYQTHRGGEIKNLNHGWFYPSVNAIAFGLYFHKYHHLTPSLFNPRHYGKTARPPAVEVESDEMDKAA